MTAPDPRPYAAPTDLVTAADVLAYQLTLLDPDPDIDLTHAIIGPWTVTLPQAIILTAFRLDRERRQACRRGALTAWRFACGQRAIERDWRKATPDEFQSREDLDEWAALAHEDRVTEVRRALAFRAAARAK